jgi:hypothetical protein
MYAEHADDVGPCKRFRLKNDLFQYISETLNAEFGGCKSQQQVLYKYKNVLKEKKKQIALKKTSGAAGGQKIAHEEELELIAAIDDSLEPDVMMGVHSNQITLKKPHPALKRRDRKPRVQRNDAAERVEMFLNGLRELAREKEISRNQREERRAAAKERRHQERLAKYDELFGHHALDTLD